MCLCDMACWDTIGLLSLSGQVEIMSSVLVYVVYIICTNLIILRLEFCFQNILTIMLILQILFNLHPQSLFYKEGVVLLHCTNFARLVLLYCTDLCVTIVLNRSGLGLRWTPRLSGTYSSKRWHT